MRPSYAAIHNLEAVEGRFFDAQQDEASAAVCVLGEKAKVSLLGYGPAVGKYVKVNDTWLQVIGVLAPQITSGSGGAGAGSQTTSSTFRSTRFNTGSGTTIFMKDDLDGVDMRLKPGADSVKRPRW